MATIARFTCNRAVCTLAVMLMLFAMQSLTSFETIEIFQISPGTVQKNLGPQQEYNDSSIPYCDSGNDYMSIAKGGSWVDTGVIHQGYSTEQLSREGVEVPVHYLCYQHKGYNDSFAWRPPCRSRALLYHHQATTTNTTAPASIKVFLWGDSLQIQILRSATFLRPKNYPEPAALPIEYKMGEHREPYFIPSSGLVFESQQSKDCQDEINNNPDIFYLKNYTTQDDLIADVLGNVTYDYIFFNEFAHYNHMTSRMTKGCFGLQNLTLQDLVIDALAYFAKEMEIIAQLLKTRFPATKVYFRTSTPHTYKWMPAFKPLEKVPMEMDPSFGYEECVSDAGKHIWRCANAFNQIAKEAFLRYGHQILDTAPAISLRVDAHPCSNNKTNGYANFNKSRTDCNHFCNPGPPDVMLQAIEAEIFAREYEKLQRQNQSYY